MPAPGNADIERFLVLCVVVAILVLMVVSIAWIRPRLLPMPTVPPTVSPQSAAVAEEVRLMRHWRANIDQKMPDIELRVVRQGDQLASIQQDIGEIKQATEKTERMMHILIESGLRREQRG